MPSFFCSRLKAGHLWRTSPLCGSGIRKNAPFPGKRRENRPDLSPLPTSPSTLGITCRVCRKGPFCVRSLSPRSAERGHLPLGSLRHPATARSAPLSLRPAPSERGNHPYHPATGYGSLVRKEVSPVCHGNAPAPPPAVRGGKHLHRLKYRLSDGNVPLPRCHSRPRRPAPQSPEKCQPQQKRPLPHPVWKASPSRWTRQRQRPPISREIGQISPHRPQSFPQC